MKPKKIAALLLCFSFLLLCKPSYASTTIKLNVGRIYGQDRYKTAAAISNNFQSGTMQNVVLVSANNFPDALAGSVLIKKLNASVLLVDKSPNTNQDYITYIKQHLGKNGTIYILGGFGIISDDFITMFHSMGYANVKRIGGKDRYDTNKMIVDNASVQSGTPVIISYGEDFPDALSASSISGINGYPILLTETNYLPNSIIEKLKQINPSKIYITGGTGVISNNVINQIRNVTNISNENIIRLWGNDRYDTSISICRYFNLKSNNIVLAYGNDFPDALSGTPLACKLNAPILLADKASIAKQKGYIESTSYSNVTILGGVGVISSNSENILNGSKAIDNVDDKIEEIVAEVITPGMNDFQKEKALHDYLVKNTRYDYDNYLKNTIPYDSYHAEGPLLKGVGVCNGYAEAMCSLLSKVNIESTIIVGPVNDSDGKSLGDHAWNLVKINGNYYHVDVTWDDPIWSDGIERDDYVRYDYYNLTDSEIGKDHFWNKDLYPHCTTEYDRSNLN